MSGQEPKKVWQELKDIWKNSPRTEKINIQMSGLLTELKSKVSQFEKDSIRRDISRVASSTSQFEKESIGKDLTWVASLIKDVVQKFRKEK